MPAEPPSVRHPPKLLDRVRIAARRRHYSLRTEHSYVRWVRRFILFHGKRHPREMGGPEIAEFLYLSLNTVKWHVKNLYGKLGVSSRVEAAAQLLGLSRQGLYTKMARHDLDAPDGG